MYARDPRRVKKIGAFLRENKFSLLAQNFPAEVSFPSTPDGAPSPALGERSGAPSGLRPSSFVMSDTPVEVQFTSAGCLNYPCRTPEYGTNNVPAPAKRELANSGSCKKLPPAAPKRPPIPAQPAVMSHVLKLVICITAAET